MMIDKVLDDVPCCFSENVQEFLESANQKYVQVFFVMCTVFFVLLYLTVNYG